MLIVIIGAPVFIVEWGHISVGSSQWILMLGPTSSCRVLYGGEMLEQTSEYGSNVSQCMAKFLTDTGKGSLPRVMYPLKREFWYHNRMRVLLKTPLERLRTSSEQSMNLRDGF